MSEERSELALDDAAIVRGRNDRDERRRLVARFEHLVSAIEALLFEHDPIGINFGDNADEYRSEAEVLVLHRGRVASVDDLSAIVHQVFVEWFDADLAGPVAQYVPIAREIWTLFGNDESRESRTDG